jgi:WD repeat-containing protein 1 (actin-interacting protein 1)
LYTPNFKPSGDVETRKSTTSYTLGSGVSAQQVGAVFSGTSPVSLSLDGTLSIFDSRIGSVARAIYGPQKAVTAATSYRESSFLVGSADGRIQQYQVAADDVTPLGGTGHTNLVSAIATAKDGKAISVAFDDTLREIEEASFMYARIAYISDSVN